MWPERGKSLLPEIALATGLGSQANFSQLFCNMTACHHANIACFARAKGASAFMRRCPPRTAAAQTRWIATSMLPRVAFEYGQIC
jgi:hypothetical protein